ncbi:unnamed protein product [Rhizophagus irregularis]|nr:unnamed protein product [Rhizophagus irregularis]
MDKFVTKEIPNAPGHLAFTLDAWTSSNFLPFLRITVHWIFKNWELKEILIDFCKLSGPHSGENLFQTFIQCCDDMRILTKIIACTTDNASNNDTLMKSLESVCQERTALSSLKVGYMENENVLLNDTDEITEVIPKVSFANLLLKFAHPPKMREIGTSM